MNGFGKLTTSLTELYAMTPVGEHKNIVVAGGRVYVRTAEGSEEYALLPGEELALVRSDILLRRELAALRMDLAKVMAKLGVYL